MLLELLEAAIVLLISIIIWQSLKKPSYYPPGPWGLPFIGYIPLGLESYYKKLMELREKHSAISWRIGSKLIVVLFDDNLIKDAYQNPAFADRPDIKSLAYLQSDRILGIILSVGEVWRKNRKFALKHLKEFGMGKSKHLLDAHFEAEGYVNELKKQVGRPAPITHSLLISILNIMWQMVGSKRYDFDDEDIQKFCELIYETHIHGPKLVVLDVFPWIKKIVPKFLLNKIFKFHVQTELSDKIKEYFMKNIEEHLEDYDENNPRDFIDAYLIEMKKQESSPDSTMSLEDLTFCVSDLFEGATETTSLSIHWTILYLAKYPKIQTRFQEEIDQLLPKGTCYAMEDKARLPYTDAFVHELLRHTSVVSQPPRAANVDTKIGDYFIPKGTVLVFQTLTVHSDGRYFESPEEFRPERFLDSEGKFLPPKEGFFPFGFGKRICIGEAIARTELFVFITKLVQNFHFAYPPGEEFNMEGVISPFFRPPKGSPNVLITLR